METAKLDPHVQALFQRLAMGPLELKNRVVLSPMTRVSATEDGRATEQMAAYYAGFAAGGFGLIETESVFVDEAFSRAKARQPGIASSAQIEAWHRVVDAVHAAGAPIFIQLQHAGAMGQGGLRGETVAPSAVAPLGGHRPVPRELTLTEIGEIVEQFALAARNARAANFDGVEVHGGNGYLIDQFLTDYTNLRTDAYGGPVERRIRFAAVVVDAVRAALPGEMPVGIRISQKKVNDPDHRWAGGERDAAVIFRSLAEAGASFLHVSAPDACAPAFERGPTLAGLAKHHGRVFVIANGRLEEPSRATAVVASGQADLISLARGALANPDWSRRVAENRTLDVFDPEMLKPFATLDNAEAWRRRRNQAATAPG